MILMVHLLGDNYVVTRFEEDRVSLVYNTMHTISLFMYW